tara:strand:+ start:1342 stop:1779 length:438 start_codon:yes stop_codon:yes gene_type:complete
MVMTDYDNTNRGAAFKPFPEQQLILQGKLNVMGEDGQVALIMAESRDGKKRIEVFQKIGCLFPNDKKGNEKAPDYSGPLDGLHQDWKIASWKEMKDDNAYMSLQVSEFKKKEPEPNTLDDIIPEFGDNIKDEEASSAHPTLAVPF